MKKSVGFRLDCYPRIRIHGLGAAMSSVQETQFTPPQAEPFPEAYAPPERVPGGPRLISLRHAGFQLWLVNVALGIPVAFLVIKRTYGEYSVGTRLFLALAILEWVAALAIIPGMGMLIVHKIGLRQERWRWIGLGQASFGAWFLAMLYTSTIVHRLLGYHLNESFLNVIFTEGSGDAIVLGPYVWLTATTVILALTFLQAMFWRWRVRRVEVREDEGRRQALALRPRFMTCALLLPVFLAREVIYTVAHFNGDHVLVHAASDHFPGLDVRVARPIELDLRPEEGTLAWPKSRPVLDPDGPRPNLFLCVLDSWRADSFTPELTPNLFEFSAGARTFQDHLSSGNATRFGLFGMLYGLHGSYWTRALETRTPPTLVETLQDAGYDIRVISAASMNFPEMRLTAWASLDADQVVDSFRDDSGRMLSRADVKDMYVAAEIERWMDEREATGDSRPFFAFVLLDSPHQPYFNPGGPYQPTVDALNYIQMGRVQEGPEVKDLQLRIHNTYRNSVMHADRVAGGIMDSLGERDLLDDTVVMITGDHGEEFFEHGVWGHTSNFTPEQVHVPFYMKGPGVKPGVESRPTSHLDISGTLLEMLGADPDLRGDYTLGENLFEPLEDRDRVMGAWAHLGVWTKEGIFRLPLEPESDVLGVYDQDWQLHPDGVERIDRMRATLESVGEECQRFLDLP